ncbi:hypothetical protein LINPERPRIM_LOCUS39527 [Linum perenne]
MASFNSSCLVLLAVVAIFAAAVSAQELAPAPAPSVETGAGSFSAGVSGAMIFSSLVVSALALLKH